MRRVVLVLLSLILCGAVWWLWPRADHAAPLAKSAAAPAAVVAHAGPAVPVVATNAAPVASALVGRSAASTNREAFRLANTSKKIGELTPLPHAILLENALVDTDAKLALNIPAHLKAAAEPGAFIVQSRGPVTAMFRALLASVGAQIISYIPNNAYLVQLSGAGAEMLAGNPQVQAVLPYEPYYKVQSSLLGRAVEQQPLEKGQILTLGLFSSGAASTVTQIENLGGRVIATDRSPFGPVVRVQPPSDWLALAQLPGVMRVEAATHRQLANDLARVTMGISTDTITNANWLGLTGNNVLVEVNDSGVDASHPDFSLTGTAATGRSGPTRVTGFSANSTLDTDGHGTHVAGILAGNGSYSIHNPEGKNIGSLASGSVTNADFRGKAALAKLYAVGIFGTETNVAINDSFLQEQAALTNALISNNSWSYGVNEYDLSAASFDAAVRDAMPTNTGPQPVLFVFAAGNDGVGDNNGGGGLADTIESPGTAKNVITVGALEQFRNITNEVVLLDGTTNAVWAEQTDSSSEVANYSARGNVGVQTEGSYGRFKPDVVAPGTFVVSTRPTGTMWDKAAYYNPTNVHEEFSQPGSFVSPGQVVYGGAYVPDNAVGVVNKVQPNHLSPNPFPTNFPIYFSQFDIPGPTNVNDIATSNNVLSIPPGSATIPDITPLLGNGFTCAVGDPTNFAINFDLIIQILTTNDNGNTLTVLSNLNETIGPWYRYESGTSMATPAASGSLALMQEFFASQRNPSLPTNPSPALLKAILINGSRLTAGYNNFAITNNINYEGWGLVNVPNSLPVSLTNTVTGPSNTVTMFVLDQSPTNVLATGDTRTYNVSVPTPQARNQLLRITLAWTDPPGNPAAAIKLVNNLDLVVTNNDTGQVYYGNVFGYAATPYSLVVSSNTASDTINNVENVWIPNQLGTNYSVTIVGRNVAVNAVTAEQTNIVQDFVLVISCGDAFNTNGVAVTAVAPPAPTFTAPPVTFISSYTNGIYFDQLAGANAPWLSTNNVVFATNSAYATNAALFIGQTNQWHFFVVTNTTTFTNAAFIIFLPDTQATPRMGVFEDSTTNSTRPEADLNLFVAPGASPGLGDSNAGDLTNLDYTVISNCVFNVNNAQASLARGGTKFIAYSNSVGQQVYYIGVQCQDQMAASFGFLSVFSQNPFSSLNPDGSQTVNGLLLPVAIPDGNNAHPGVGYCISLALYPMAVGGLTVTNTITSEDFGDLLGILSHGNVSTVLNNHNPDLTSPNIYNDTGQPGTVGTDGPGSLRNFTSKEAAGPWIMTQVDDAATASSSITGFTMNIQPHQDLTHGAVQVFVPAGGWFYGYVDVPVGYTNMFIGATNITSPPQLNPDLQMYFNTNVEPTQTSYLIRSDLTNSAPLGLYANISYGPPLEPERYFIGLFNNSAFPQTVWLGVTLAFNAAAETKDQYDSTGPVPLTDDAVSYSYIDVTESNPIQEFSVGLRVDHPRISDLTFTLINPEGTRYLLMENRGGQSTNGAGVTIITTNIVNVSASGGPQANTNIINVGMTSGTFPITYNFYTVPDQMTVYYGTNVDSAYIITNTGMISGMGTIFASFPPAGVSANSTYLTIVMNQFTNAGPTAWTYTAGGVQTNNYYLAFTEDTNLTTTPIKYAVPPFVPGTNLQAVIATNYTFTWFSSFEGGTNNYVVPTGNYFAEGWHVDSGEVDVITNGTLGATPFDGNYFINLNGGSGGGTGTISTNVPTTNGASYILTFAYANNPNATIAPELQLLINGTNKLTVMPAAGNSWTNLEWTTASVVFTATSATNLIQFSSTTMDTNGVLLDGLSLQQASAVTNFIPVQNNLYYQPEDDISGLIGTSPFGTWTLEILDNRAGATNDAQLVSWQLNITVANTNFTATINTNLGNGAITNYIPGGGLQWYAIVVPTNVDWATNSLLFATLPLNMWWSTNVPPTITNTPSDTQLLGSSLGGVSVLGTNTTPAFIIPGGTYYLGIQNTNVGGANYALDVTFHYLAISPRVITLPPTDLELTSATLRAVAHPGYTEAGVYFEYGTTTNFGLVSASFDITNNFNFFQLASIGVTNLSPETTYYFRAVATNSVGTNYGNTLTFFTTPFPQAQTLPATLVTGASAQLNGFATPNASSLPTTAWFEWGTNRAYGNQTPPVNVGNGFAVVYTNALITGLLTNVPYHFRLVISNAQAVVYGFDQVLDQANVVAWGANFLGQLNVPAGLSNVVAIAAAYDHSLALNSSGTAVGWGENSVGQATVPASLSNLVAVAGGEYFSSVLKADGTVAAWGADVFPGQTNVPAGLNNVVYLAAGRFASLALKNDGTIIPWGVNFSGLTTVPPGVTNVVGVAGGSLHNLALINNGTVAAWGDDSFGQTNVPAGLNNVVAIAAGGLHSLALKYDGTVVAWGDNSDGQTNVPAGLTNVVAIAAGGFHSLALRQDGSIVAWGDDSTGQLNVPAGLTNVVAISSGNLHNLVLTPQSFSNLTNGIVLTLTNGVPGTNSILAGAVTYYQVDVPTNADFATNSLLFTINGSLNVWFSTNNPPTIGGSHDRLLLAGATNGVSILSTTSAPTNIVPGGTYYLGVQNTNTVTVTYGIQVDFHFTASTNSPGLTNAITIASIVYTNIAGSNGFLLTWFAPSNDLFQVQWTASLSPTNWQSFSNTVSQNTNAPGVPPNAQFNFFDNGSQTGGFGPTRFYRLILLTSAANILTLPPQTNRIVSTSSSVTVTNTATDSNPAATVTYSLVNAPVGASIGTNGVITWTSTTPGLAARFITLATDNGSPQASVTNTFTVFVLPFPSISTVSVTATNESLSWSAPTNDQFQVQWSTNLVTWMLYPNNAFPLTITSTNGTFAFTDTNAPLLMKFYQLILLP